MSQNVKVVGEFDILFVYLHCQKGIKMTINRLLELGFEVEFVSIEESGGNPFVYFTNDFLISNLIELDFELNERFRAMSYVIKNRDEDLEVNIFGDDRELSDEVVEYFSKGIKLLNESTKAE